MQVHVPFFKGELVAILALVVADHSLSQSLDSMGPQTPQYESWIGKRLVRSGELYKGTEQVIREDDIPQPYRIFSPDRSIGDMMYDLNRTNVFINSGSIIVRVTKG